MQDKLMKFCPMTGKENPYPSLAAHFREYHGCVAWLYNPWTGDKRNLSSVGTDPEGLMIVK
jgi:hypothetical protein